MQIAYVQARSVINHQHSGALGGASKGKLTYRPATDALPKRVLIGPDRLPNPCSAARIRIQGRGEGRVRRGGRARRGSWCSGNAALRRRRRGCP